MGTNPATPQPKRHNRRRTPNTNGMGMANHDNPERHHRDPGPHRRRQTLTHQPTNPPDASPREPGLFLCPHGATKETTLNNLERFSTSAVSVADSLQAKADLEWIAARWNDLKDRLIPPTTPNTGAGRPAPSSRPPLNPHISDLLHTIEVEARMLGWTLMEETPGGWRPTSSSMPQLLIDVAQQHGHWTTQNDQTALAFTDWAHEYRWRVERALE